MTLLELVSNPVEGVRLKLIHTLFSIINILEVRNYLDSFAAIVSLSRSFAAFVPPACRVGKSPWRVGEQRNR